MKKPGPRLVRKLGEWRRANGQDSKPTNVAEISHASVGTQASI